MKLKDFVDHSIYDYPTLYRSFNYQKSRLLVLNHVFISYGTALEWSPKGFLSYLGEKDGEYKIFKSKRLPKNYFEIDLWYIPLFKKDLPKVKNILKGHLHYIQGRILQGDLSIVFEANKELATELTEKFGARDSRMSETFKAATGRDMPIHSSMAASFDRAHPGLSVNFNRMKHTATPETFLETEYEPSDVCRYSPIVEMINKRTDSPHIKNFDLTFIQPDWIEGAIEVSKWALGFYKDPNRNKFSHCHPSNCLKQFKESYDKDPVKFREDWGKEGMTKDHTIEQWCEIVWQRRLTEKICYFEKLLKIYDREG